MSTAPQLPLADDGLPKVDVIELATALLHPGTSHRRTTMVSMREARAMAEALLNFNQLLTDTAWLLALIASAADAKSDIERRMKLDAATAASDALQYRLATLGYMEARDDTH